jgi:ABC-type antimicrobial peptide transport system permease subunit
LPYAQNSTTVVTLVARADGQAGTAAPAIRNAVAAVDPETPVSYETSFEDVVRESLARPREMAWLVGVFAGLALVLSAIGVYGVMAYLTASRTQEIGIRMALGAAPLDIVSLILRQAMVLTAIGVSLGVVVAPMAMRLTSGFLFGVSPFDPTTPVAVALLLTGTSIAAAAIPALRASRLAATSFR